MSELRRPKYPKGFTCKTVGQEGPRGTFLLEHWPPNLTGAYVCMYICLHMHRDTPKHKCTCVCVYICRPLHTRTYIHKHAYVHTYIKTYKLGYGLAVSLVP